MAHRMETERVEEIIINIMNKLSAAPYALHRKLFAEQVEAKRAKAIADLDNEATKATIPTKESSE